MTRDDAIKWLEDLATYYETSNNQAFVRPGEPQRYHRQDATAWKVAQLIREYAAENERLRAVLEDVLVWMENLGLEHLIDDPVRGRKHERRLYDAVHTALERKADG